MENNTRHPFRIPEYSDDNKYYPRELTEKDGRLYLVDEDGSKLILRSDVYVGSGDMPDGYVVQIDPEGEALQIMSADEVNILIVEELAKRGQLKPEFANSIDECTDTSKLYVLPDGYIYAYMPTTYTNVLPLSTTNDGMTIYNVDGTPGYKKNTRWSNSSSAEVVANDIYLTGFIPVSPGDVIRLKNITMLESDENTCLVFFFGDDITGVYSGSHNGTNLVKYNSAVWGEDGNLSEFVIQATSTYQYIRIQCGGIDETSIITINEEITDGLIYSWKNTNHAFVPATNGSSNVKIPEYWLDALKEGAKAINTALTTAGYNKSAFLFYSDAHWNYGSQMSPTLLKYLHNHTGMTKTFFGGDIVNNEAADYDTMSYLWDWRNQLKDLPNHHSVVGNHDDGNATNNLFSEQYVYGYLLAAEETPDIVRGDSGMYYYIDSPAEKTRYLFIDTAYRGVGTDQKDFIKQALLSTPSGWHIVAVAHIWYDTDYTTSPPTVGDLNSGASTLLTMFDNYNSRSGDYTTCGGWVEFCIGGHTHRDYDGASSAGIPIVLVETDSAAVRSGLDYIDDTTTESSVNGIIADYNNNKLYVVRVGRGQSREVKLNRYTVNVEGVTNQIPISTDTDGSIFNGVGYQSGKRINSAGSIVDSANYSITGFIPFTYGDVLYGTYDIYSGNPGNCNVVGYNANKEYITNANAYFNNSTAFTFDKNNIFAFDPSTLTSGTSAWLNVTYVRVTGMNSITEESVITVNEPIE